MTIRKKRGLLNFVKLFKYNPPFYFKRGKEEKRGKEYAISTP
jgi:hypothetical protein